VKEYSSILKSKKKINGGLNMKNLAYIFMIFCAVSLPLAAAAGDPNEYMVNLESLNDSGVTGTAWITVTDGKYLTVEIEATGLEPGKPHPQHIHGLNKPPAKNSTCPTPEADADGDGIVSVGEGLPYYGPIILPLIPFDLVDEDGNLSYFGTFTIRPNEFQPLHKRTVVLHGLTVGDTYVPSTPVACGEIINLE